MTARATLAAMGLPPREALRFFLQKVNVPTRRWDDIWGEQHSHAFMVAGATSQALLDDFRAEIQVTSVNVVEKADGLEVATVQAALGGSCRVSWVGAGLSISPMRVSSSFPPPAVQ